jgi:hypothetical protein
MTKAKPKTSAKSAKGDAEERPADAPFPPSGANELRDNATTAADIAGKVDGKEESGATKNAKSVDAANAQIEAKEEQSREEEDNSIFGKILRSGLFHVRDHVLDQTYIGISPQADPDASPASKSRSVVTGLDVVPPRTGLTVRPKDGEAFAIGDGFNLDSKPEDWARVLNPSTGKPLFG